MLLRYQKRSVSPVSIQFGTTSAPAIMRSVFQVRKRSAQAMEALTGERFREDMLSMAAQGGEEVDLVRLRAWRTPW